MQDIPTVMRQRILAACDADHRTAEVASWFGVCESIVRRFKQRRRELGETAPRKRGRRDPGTWTEERLDQLRGLVAAEPGATIARLREQLLELHAIDVSERTVGRGLKKAGLSLKKSR